MGKNHFLILFVILFTQLFLTQNAKACNTPISVLMYAGVNFPQEYDKGCVDVTNAGALTAFAHSFMTAGAINDNVPEYKGPQRAFAKLRCARSEPISLGNREFGGDGSTYFWSCSTKTAEAIKMELCNTRAATESRFNKFIVGMPEGTKITYTYKDNKCMCSLTGFEGERDCSKVFPFGQDINNYKAKIAADAEKKAADEKAAADLRRQNFVANSNKCKEIGGALIPDRANGTQNSDLKCKCNSSGDVVSYSIEVLKPEDLRCKKAVVQQTTSPTRATTNKSCEELGDMTTPPAPALGGEDDASAAQASVENSCICKNVTPEKTVDRSAQGLAACQEASRQQVAAAAAAPTEPTQDLKTCVENGEKELKSCQEIQTQAVAKCDEKNLDKDAEKVTNAVSGAYISSKSGTGAQQQCFTASLASNIALNATKVAKDECDALVTSCKSKCANEVFDKIEKECKPKIAGIAVNEQYYNAKANPIKSGLNESLNTCETKVEKDKLVLSDLLNSLGDSLGKSLQCMCQLSSGTTTSSKEGCNVPDIATCEKNPSLPNCKPYVGIGACTPGSGYDAKLCACQMNPKGAGCPGGGASGNLVGFASGANLSNGSGAGDASIGSPVSDLKASGTSDLSGLGNNNTGPAGNLTMEPTKINSSAGGSAGGAGAGGAGGGGAGPEAGSGGGAGESERSALGGLFNQAKNFVSNVIGGGDKLKQNGALKGDSKNKKADVDKFRPRGMASNDSILGTKNMDIWKMMNLCTSGENCKSNVNNYILGP